MIIDPYKVLGVSEDVSDAELKKAYRDLSKKWHPDANPDDPERAEATFKEIQEAYTQIVDARAKGTSAYGRAQQSSSGSGYGSGGSYADYGGFGGFEEFFNQWTQYSNDRRRQEESNEMTAARNYINNGYYREAMNALQQVAEASRNARWFYYAAIASQGLGNNIDAMNYARRAADMEPGNAEYRNLLSQLQTGGTWYTRRGENYGGFGGVDSTTGWCLSMLALNLCCGCGGGGFFCI
jgi:molecular chaperone DnaJ